VILFAIATALPCGLLAVAALFGGAWVWLLLGYMSGLVFVLDRIAARAAPNAEPDAEFPAATPLLVVLGLCHFPLLGLAVWSVGGESGLSIAERVGLGLAAGLIFGQVAHPAAHELIHRPRRALHRLGQAVYSSLLAGHHASAHLLVHHTHVGRRADPNSAPRGMGFYRFALRAAPTAFRAGLAAENRRRGRAIAPLGAHPYLLYLGGAGATLAMAWALAGPTGLLAALAIAAHAQLQILLSDYVQHYGLRRRQLPDGRPEPVGPQHSWNAPHVFSSALMLNAPRHSDPHVAPGRAYPALQLDGADMPCLPASLPVMAVLALVPPLWRRVMDPLCDPWHPAPDRPDKTRARDIPQGVLDRVKPAGAAGPHLPNSPHASPIAKPSSADRRATGGGRPDERGGI